MFRGPAQALLRRHRTPALAQGTAFCRGQRLESLECFAHAGALLRTEVMEGARVLAQLAALFRRHLGPLGQTLADQRLFFRRQGCPMACVVREMPSPLWWQLVPLVAHGRKHPLLTDRKAGPVQRLLRDIGLRPRHRWRGTWRFRRRRLGRCRRCGQQARSDGDSHEWHESLHISSCLRLQRMRCLVVPRASDRNRGPGPFPSGCCRPRGRAHRHCPGSRRSEPMKRWGQRRV